MKRAFDVLLAGTGLLLLLPVFLVLWVLVRVTSRGGAIYWSDRVGCGNRIFSMPKFRSMWTGTPAVATHLLADPDDLVTPLGRFIRSTSLDELPQLWSVLMGHMSLVGPRPALFNQHDLIEARTRLGIHRLRPGITGWAQVNGRDDIALERKVALDAEYMDRQSFGLDIHIMLLTIFRVLRRQGIRH